jgi:hypothetical protein
MADTRKIQVAVMGGGVAGAAIARALHGQDHIEVNVYESAPEFSGRGMAIIMAINAQRALGKLVPDVDEIFDRAGAVTVNSTRIMLVSSYPPGPFIVAECWRKIETDGGIGRWASRRHESGRCCGRKTGKGSASSSIAA